MKRIRIFFTMLTVISINAVGQQDPQISSNRPACAVVMRVIGADLTSPPYIIESFTGESDEEFKGRFTGLSAIVPCGQYRLVLARTDVPVSTRTDRPPSTCGKIFRKLDLIRPENWLTLPTDPNIIVVADRCGAVEKRLPVGFALQGIILPIPENDKNTTWIRLQSPFDPNDFVEAKADANGEFRIYQVLNNNYLLYVERGGELWHLETISFKNQISYETLVIKLGDKPLAKRIVK